MLNKYLMSGGLLCRHEYTQNEFTNGRVLRESVGETGRVCAGVPGRRLGFQQGWNGGLQSGLSEEGCSGVIGEGMNVPRGSSRHSH